MRPNAWPNTPDILTEQLQHGGRAMFVTRAILAATLSANWGIYGPAFELIEHRAIGPARRSTSTRRSTSCARGGSRPGIDRATDRAPQRDPPRQPALHHLRTLRFHDSDASGILCYSKVDPFGKGDPILCVVNVDARNRQAGNVHVDPHTFGIGIGDDDEFEVHDLLGGGVYRSRGWHNFVDLTPGPVSRDRVLRAVAVDAAGNTSAQAVASYTLPWTGKPTDLSPTSWSVTSAAPPAGGTVDTASDDGRYLSVASAPVASRPTVDVTATMTVPVDLRSAVSVSVSTSLRSTLRGTRLRAQYWDASTSTWRAVETTTEGLDESKVDVDLGAVTKLVDADGKLRIRYIADQGRAFDLAVDRVAVTLVNRR